MQGGAVADARWEGVELSRRHPALQPVTGRKSVSVNLTVTVVCLQTPLSRLKLNCHPFRSDVYWFKLWLSPQAVTQIPGSRARRYI